MTDRRRKEKKNPSQDYIDLICALYGDRYDDREEDSRPGGEDWVPGTKALHTSLAAFQKELEERGIKISTAKIRKILITGGCWTTERSREVQALYEKLGSVKKVAKALGLTEALVTMYGGRVMKNAIIEVLMHRDGMSRREAEEELRRVQESFDPTCDDPEEVLAYEFGLEPDYIFDLLDW